MSSFAGLPATFVSSRMFSSPGLVSSRMSSSSMVPARRRFVPVAKGGRPVEKMDYELSPPGFSRENMAKSLEFQGLMQLTGGC
jgi:hypothetical protein